MKRYVLLGLKLLGCILGILIVILVVAALIVNSSSFQNKVMDYSTNMLSEKLNTKVKIDSVSVSVFTFDFNLMGLEIEDQQQRKMLQADQLSVNFDIWALMTKRVKISKADIDGVRARLYKPEDGPANYQFVLDAFKSDKPKTGKKQPKDKKKGSKLALDIASLKISRIDIVFNEDSFYLERLKYDNGWLGGQKGEIRHLRGKLDRQTKKGDTLTNKVSMAMLTLSEKGERHLVTIDSLHLSIDNHKPRKNAGKPHRGYFDPGHLDILANLELSLNYYAKDTANVSLTKCVAIDSITGFNVKDLRFQAGINKEKAFLNDVTIQQESTVLTFTNAVVQLPSKKAGRKLAYHTSRISGKTILKDISRPFAPALGNFKIPVELKVDFSGTDSTMQFDNIHVNTSDQRLALDAVGGITHLQDKDLLDIRFHVKDMVAKGNVAQDIINQFVVKKFMMKQLKALGTIHYTGNVVIIKKKEAFDGLLKTAGGNLNFDFSLDESTKYLRGNAKTSAFQLGRIMGMPDIGAIACKANFTFDYSKPRTAQMRRKYGGKLPIGSVDATVYEANYKKVKVKNLDVTIKSDGVEATGSISQDNKSLDWACDFTFTDTESLHKIKVKPKVKLKWNSFIKKNGNTSDAEKQKQKDEKAAKKAQKAAEKAAKKERKAAEKAAKKKQR